MAKIYNEIVIDMNPESSTFEEVLHEDSFEYSGDIILAQGDNPFSGESFYRINEDKTGYDELQWDETRDPPRFTTKANNIALEDIDAGALTYKTKEEFNTATGAVTYGGEDFDYSLGWIPGYQGHEPGDTIYTKQPDYGAPLLTRDDFFFPDGTRRDATEIAKTLLESGAGGGKGEVDAQGNPTDITDINEMTAMVLQFFPQLEEIDPTKAGFLEEQYGPGGIEGQAAGITYGTAGRTYDLAGITKEAAEETYTLGKKSAGRTKDTMLSGLQESAYGVGAPTTGRDLRSTIRGKGKIKEGFGTGMEAYQDVVTGLEGDLGRAQDIYGIAGETYGAAGDTYDVAGARSDLSYRKGMYDLEYGEYGSYSSFENEIQNIFFKEGGRVPSKESFSNFLTQLPDAGGM